MKRNTLKKSVSLLIAAIMLLAVLALPISAEGETAEAPKYTANTSWEGAGTEANPYLIKTPENLLGFAENIATSATNNKFFRLDADIDLNPGYTGGDTEPTNVWSFNSTAFSGTFDGNGHTVSGIYQKTTDRAGIFGGQLGTSALTVKNLSIVNSYVSGDGQYVGGIIALTAGNSGALTLENLYMDVNVNSTLSSGSAKCGGLIGRIGATTATVKIKDCVVVGNISTDGAGQVGGFIGITETTGDNVSIASSAFYGNINIDSATATNYISGFVGVVWSKSTKFTIDKCIMAGNINYTAKPTSSGAVLKANTDATTITMSNCLYIDVYSHTKPINTPSDASNITLTNNKKIVAADITGLAALDIIDPTAWKASPENGYPLPSPVYYMLYAEASDNEGNGLTKLVGYQASEPVDEKYYLRLVAVLTTEEYEQLSKIGFNVTLSYNENGQTKTSTKTRDIYTVYNSIYANVGTETLEYTAAELGGKYIYALVIENIPTSIDALEIDVTTFHVESGSAEAITGSTSKVTIKTSSLIGDAQ